MGNARILENKKYIQLCAVMITLTRHVDVARFPSLFWSSPLPKVDQSFLRRIQSCTKSVLLDLGAFLEKDLSSKYIFLTLIDE